MAHAHYLKPSSFLNMYIKRNRNAYVRRDIDFYNNKEFFDILESKSILSHEELLNMSLRSMEGHLFTSTDFYPPKQIRKLVDKRSHYGLMYCPKCLFEDKIPYWRKHWRYTFYTACPKHKIFLTDRCWHCYKPIKLLKMNISNKIVYCSNCGADLSLTQTHKISIYNNYGLKTVTWFETGLKNDFFKIEGNKIWSVMFFKVYNRFKNLLDRKELLKLDTFVAINKYKYLCNKLKNYHSKKSIHVYKDFLLNNMIYHIFQNYPKNFLEFIVFNKLTNRDFTHALKYKPFWYQNMIDKLIPKENKKGRIISKSEVLGAINYLKKINKTVNQLEVSKIIGCHSTIHKGFKKIYKNLIELNNIKLF